jgi:peroxidase
MCFIEIILSCAGFYKCIATNTEGMDEHQAELKIVGSFGPPTFVYEPYDLDTLPGATIELPCKGEGEPSPEVSWQDGINNNEKYG